MGCTSSKHLGRHASMEQCTSPQHASARTSEYSVEYHQHIVALTSSSYGQINDVRPSDSCKSSNDVTSRVGSLNEMYSKLISLEMNKSVDIHTLHSTLHSPLRRETFCTPALPSLAGCKSSCSPSDRHEWAGGNSSCSPSNHHEWAGGNSSWSPSNQQEWHINSTEFVISETINVKELMIGFEEKPSPRGLWQAEHASSANGEMLPVQRGAPILKQPKKMLERPLHTVEEVDVMSKKSGTLIQHGSNEEEYESGKENNGADHNHHFRSARGSLGNSPLSQISQPSLMLRDARKRHTLSNSKPSPQNSTFSSSLEAKRKGAIKHERSEPFHCTQQQRKKFASDMPLLMSMSRRMTVKENFLSTEPSSPLFDPNMVASYERALKNVSEENWNACLVDSPEVERTRASVTSHNEQQDVIGRCDHSTMVEAKGRPQDVLGCYPIKCPSGGGDTLVLYTTTLRGIRKTFEDCENMRGILQSYGLSIDERDVSMHLGFLNELRGLMDRVLAVPRLFIKGRYIGGVEEVGKLHEDGKLIELVEGLPREGNRGNCEGCDGIRFVPCLECRGSCKIRCEDKNVVIRCPDCNENGLIQCPICT